MQKITSFEVNHNTLIPGLYISRIDGDITTYDLRTRVPNSGSYMDNSTMHTAEHMLATYLRNSSIKDSILYFGPMGCQTGFYLLVRNADDEVVLQVLKQCISLVLSHKGEVFGNSAKECGNYRTLSLKKAQDELYAYSEVLKKTDSKNLTYIK